MTDEPISPATEVPAAEWRISDDIPRARKEELLRCLSHTKGVDASSHPFSGMRLTRADLEWLLLRDGHSDADASSCDGQPSSRDTVAEQDHIVETQANQVEPGSIDEERTASSFSLDLRGADLSGQDLSYLPLSNVLAGYRGHGMIDRLSDEALLDARVSFVECILVGTDLRHAVLVGADFSAAKADLVLFDDAEMQFTDLRGARFFDCSMMRANLSYVNAERASFEAVKLSGAVLGGANLAGCDLSYCFAEGADFVFARVHRPGVLQHAPANLEGARFDHGRMEGARLGDYQIRGVHADGASFFLTHLEAADLTKAELRGVDLSTASLAGASLREAHLEGSAFGRAGSGTTGGTQLASSRFMAEAPDSRTTYLARREELGSQLVLVSTVLADFHGLDRSRIGFDIRTTDQYRGDGLKRVRRFVPGFAEIQPAADLRGAFFSTETDLTGLVLTTGELADGVLVEGVRWGDADLSVIDWATVEMIGDERRIHLESRPHEDFPMLIRLPLVDDGLSSTERQKRERAEAARERGRLTRAAIRTNQQLASVLRSQGLNQHGDHFAYRLRQLERGLAFKERHYVRHAGLTILWMVGGYGYRPARAVASYFALIVVFAGIYFMAGSHSLVEAVTLSVSASQGRGVSVDSALGSVDAIVGAIEALLGLAIEVIAVATFAQRFLAR